jgi:hypothetical protein
MLAGRARICDVTMRLGFASIVLAQFGSTQGERRNDGTTERRHHAEGAEMGSTRSRPVGVILRSVATKGSLSLSQSPPFRRGFRGSYGFFGKNQKKQFLGFPRSSVKSAESGSRQFWVLEIEQRDLPRRESDPFTAARLRSPRFGMTLRCVTRRPSARKPSTWQS